MTSLLSAGSYAPSTVAVPDGYPNPIADDAIDIASVAGLELFDWQRGVLRDSMARRGTKWAASEVGLIVARQNGKGSVLEARQIAGLFVIGERLQIHSAHEFKTCYEHFRRVKDLIESTPVLSERVKIIRTGAGDQAIELKNGCRIRFIARSRSSGRGFSADVVYLDEAFELSDATMGALLPALSARPDPQIWYTSSAPHRDSVVLHRIRQRGHGGNDPGLYFAEWACSTDDDPASPESWAKANPSIGLLIDPERIATAQRSLEPAEFAREHLGIPEELSTVENSAIPNWPELAVPGSTIESHQAWALSVSPDRAWASIGKAGRTAEGKYHVEWMEHRAGTGWIVDRVLHYYGVKRVPLRIHKSGPEAALIQPLREQRVEVIEVSSAEVAQATGQLIDAAANGMLVHLGQPSLDKAVRGAVLKMSTDGASMFSQRQSNVEISPLQAVVVALHGVPDAQGSTYEGPLVTFR